MATCYNPVKDYFSRFELAWEYRSDSSKQLKCWLDPAGKNSQTLSGKRFYQEEDLCLAYTNLESFDKPGDIALRDSSGFAGYWGGSNNAGITEFSERYIIPDNIKLHGVSLGIGKIKLTPGADNEIKVNVYNGGESPETRIFTKTVKISHLVQDAMNFVAFSQTVIPADTFFVGFELGNLQPTDTFAVYQSLRDPGEQNFFWFKQHGDWYNFKSSNRDGLSIANVFELVICNMTAIPADTPLVHKPEEALVYPNPASAPFTFESGREFLPEDIRVYNLLGQEVEAKLSNYHNKKIQIDLSGNVPGVYFIRLRTGQESVSKKISYIPW